MLRTLLELGRVSNLPTVWTNLAAAWIIGGGSLGDFRLAGLVLGGSLLYLAGMALNDAAGAGFDREHKPDRPIPQGRIEEPTAWILGCLCLAGGAAALRLSGAPAVPLAAIVTLILGYTFSHKHWRGCIFLMGGIRACLYLIGGGAAVRMASPTASTDLFPAIALPVWALAIGLYTVLLTRTARCEYPDSTGKPTLPLALLLIPVAATVVTSALVIPSGAPVTGTPLLAAIAYILWLKRARADLSAGQVGKTVGKLLAGFALIDSLAVSTTDPYLALVFLALAPLLLLWQKVVAAT